MFNDLRSAPEVRDRYQFWFYLYATAQPFWYSAAQLRADLAQMRQTVDPNHQQPALDQMVLVGHSMGGLVGHLQTMESGDRYWNVISREPFDRVNASAEVKQTLAQTFFFHPNPSIRQVIFIGTPHQGSAYVDDGIRWAGQRLIRLPKMLVNGGQELHRDNPAFFTSKNLIDVSTSLDSLSPSCPIFPVMAQPQSPSPVHYHNIVGKVPDKFLQKVNSGDGVVSQDSAHFDAAESEAVVPAEHSVLHRHPLSVLEVRRILLEHAATLQLTPPVKVQGSVQVVGPAMPGMQAPSPPPLPVAPAGQPGPQWSPQGMQVPGDAASRSVYPPMIRQ
jgi:hypothetical protein